jgi:hypothetical protein
VQVLAGESAPPLKGSAVRASPALRNIVSAQKPHWQF